MPEDYKQAIQDYYAAAAVAADPSLCCVDGAFWSLPGLEFPPRMLEMNYGCGSTVHPSDLSGEEPVLYVGVGGGLEALQFAYFRRRPGGVIAVDPVAEMREAAARNLEEAARVNAWFRSEFVRIAEGTADALPVPGESVGVVAQNCLFNVFTEADLARALAEVERVLGIGGRFSTSDPVTTAPLPEALRRNATLRARCISGCTTYGRYLAALHASGFQRLVVRARRPYRLLLPAEFPELGQSVLLESLEVLAIKTGGVGPAPDVFTGRHAVYVGKDRFAVHDGNSFSAGTPVHVSDRLAAELEPRPDFVVTAPTYHARAAGCC
ncbi:MAG TPA: methyltransferase domain-containing protein [Planctomycetota bacterium]|jgi:SAM-dependent methyltransferase|nr:methyltransferase domain-containing protein [Planctomycetota bacterium]